MKPFVDNYDLKRLPVLNTLRLEIARAHAAVQKLEGGVEGTLADRAHATAVFLNLFKVSAQEAINRTRVDMISELDLLAMLDKVLPKFNCDMMRGTTHKSDEPIWMCGVREGGHDDKPMANGYAVCSNPTVALMQAVLRMLDTLVAQAQVERLRANEFTYAYGGRRSGRILAGFDMAARESIALDVNWKKVKEDMEQALFSKKMENARRAVRMFPSNKTPFPKMWRPAFDAVHLEYALREHETAIRKLVPINATDPRMLDTVEAGLKAFRYAILGVNPPG